MSFFNKDGFEHFWSNLKSYLGENYATKKEVPTSLPANGGNADTLDNKHASDFVLTTDIDGFATEEWVEQQGYLVTTDEEVTDSSSDYATVEYINSLNHVTKTEMLDEINRQITRAITSSY